MKSAVVIAALALSLAVGVGQPAPDSLDPYRKDLEANRRSSLTHFRIAEILSQQGNYQDAANEFRDALVGDLQPRWTEVWAHIGLARIYDITGQRERAIREYQLAVATRDNTQGAVTEATNRLQARDTAIAQPVSITSVQSAPAAPFSRTDPEYSDEARLAELEGSVIVICDADADGRATNLRVGQSMGLGLDEKAIEAVRDWRFRPNTKSNSVAVDFSLSSKQSRWHLLGVHFRPPDETSRPKVLSAFYPSGAGVFNSTAIEEGRLLGAIGRQAFVALSFDVDERGVPVHIEVVRSSGTVWNDQAETVLRGWRFTPGMKEGRPVSVPCTFDFAWGPRILGLREVSSLQSALQAPAPLPAAAVLALPQLIDGPNPPYPANTPPDARPEGTVTVALSVGPDGIPSYIRVAKGLGPSVDQSVIDTLGKWRFTPTVLNGRTISMGLIIEVTYQPPDQVSSRILDPPTAR